ncbi:MAG TPA: NfeD family protein [Gaiellaceae bacterium]|nr:NfeD family protein [Gaiellaceae bacterium]
MAFLIALGLALFVLDEPWSYVVVAAGAVVEFGEAWFWWWLSHRRAPAVGVETLVGRRGVVTAPCRPEGQVRVAGELWRATCVDGAEPGTEVEVVAVEGLALVVSRADV